jgi:hypothetical protein
MKSELVKHKQKLISIILLVVSAFLAVLAGVKAKDLVAASNNPHRLEDEAAAREEIAETDMKDLLADARKVAEDLKEKNLFAPPPPKQHPVKQVAAIMGDEVLVGSRWYKVDDTIGDATIVAIEPARVKIKWNDNEKYFAPIDGGSSPGPPGRRPGGPRAEAGATAEEGPQAVQVQVDVGGGPGMGRFGGLSEEQRASMRERFARMRERFENMSPEERERFRAEMRERFGGRRPGGPGGPPGGRGRRGR